MRKPTTNSKINGLPMSFVRLVSKTATAGTMQRGRTERRRLEAEQRRRETKQARGVSAKQSARIEDGYFDHTTNLRGLSLRNQKLFA